MASINWSAIRIGYKTRREIWVFRINNSILGPRLIRARRGGHGKSVALDTIPESVRQWLTLEDNGRGLQVSWSDVKNCPALSPEVLKLTAIGGICVVVTARLDVAYPFEETGIEIISEEIGESGEYITEFLSPTSDPDQVEQSAQFLDEYVASVAKDAGWEV